MGDVAKANDIENRLIDFAVRIIKLGDVLPKTPSGNQRIHQNCKAKVTMFTS